MVPLNCAVPRIAGFADPIYAIVCNPSTTSTYNLNLNRNVIDFCKKKRTVGTFIAIQLLNNITYSAYLLVFIYFSAIFANWIILDRYSRADLEILFDGTIFQRVIFRKIILLRYKVRYYLYRFHISIQKTTHRHCTIYFITYYRFFFN